MIPSYQSTIEVRSDAAQKQWELLRDDRCQSSRLRRTSICILLNAWLSTGLCSSAKVWIWCEVNGAWRAKLSYDITRLELYRCWCRMKVLGNRLKLRHCDVLVIIKKLCWSTRFQIICFLCSESISVICGLPRVVATWVVNRDAYNIDPN